MHPWVQQLKRILWTALWAVVHLNSKMCKSQQNKSSKPTNNKEALSITLKNTCQSEEWMARIEMKVVGREAKVPID